MSYGQIGRRYSHPADAAHRSGERPRPRLSPQRLLERGSASGAPNDHDRDALMAALDALDQRLLFYSCDGVLVHATRGFRKAVADDEPRLREEIQLFAASSCGLARLRRMKEGEVVERMVVQELAGTPSRRLVASYIGLDLFGGGPTVLIAMEAGATDPLDADLLKQRFGFTAAQCRVARLLARGHTNREIADALCLSPHTARNHTQSILQKIGVNSRAQVASVLLRLHSGGFENEQN